MQRLDPSIPSQLVLALAPDLVLMVGAMILLLVAVWRRESAAHQRLVGWGSLIVCGLAAGAVIAMMAAGVTGAPGIIAIDGFRWVTDLLILFASVLAIALAMDYGEREELIVSESFVLILLASSGMMLLAAARDLIMVFLGIELMSIGVYVLSGLNRRSDRAAEAALKYFLLGAFSTGFLLYGIALIYGATGTTEIGRIAAAISVGGGVASPILLVGMGLLLVGFGFKVAAAPFHMWTPDVYEGAPTPYTAYMAAGVKAAAFAAFLRVWLEAFGALYNTWHTAIWWLAAITMVVGNVIALSQRNIKRMLAYSSIAHAGYLLVALVAGAGGAPAFLFYLVAYTLATMGAFGVVVALGERDPRSLDIDSYAGLWRVRPWLASAMAVFMLALLGFPIAGGMGFFAKWYVLQAALHEPPQTRLAVVLVLTSVISAGYYLGVIRTMFMRPRADDAPALASVPWLTGTVIALTAATLLLFGVFPNAIVARAQRSRPVTANEARLAGPVLPAPSTPGH